MSKDKKKPKYAQLDDPDNEWNREPRCELRVGRGWEKYATHAIPDFVELGFQPTLISSSYGELQIEGEGVITALVADLSLEKANFLSHVCEFFWLGGRTKAVKGRCARHKD